MHPQDDPEPAEGSLDRLQARLLPLADLTMHVLLSRPASGSLRATRVTGVTIALALGVLLATVLLGALLLARTVGGGSGAWLALELPLLALALGCLDLAAYGLRQRLLR